MLTVSWVQWQLLPVILKGKSIIIFFCMKCGTCHFFIQKSYRGGHLAKRLRCCLRCPHPILSTWTLVLALLLIPASCKCIPWEIAYAQILGSLPPTWEPQNEFQTSDLSSSSPRYRGHLGSGPADEDLSLSIILPLK